ncbi:hypothetical protein D3C72_1459660 [compost metagenome]
MYCSRSTLRVLQVVHESTKQPTPTWSPTLNLLTLAPTAVTTPAISWPGTIGKAAPPHSSRAWWISEWHTPQYLIEMATSSARGARRSNENGCSAEVGPSAA